MLHEVHIINFVMLVGARERFVTLEAELFAWVSMGVAAAAATCNNRHSITSRVLRNEGPLQSMSKAFGFL